MEWNVLYHDFNGKDIKTYNVFEHSGFKSDVEKYLKECDNKETFSEKVRRSLMYYFWSKAEWEIIVTSWPPYIDMKELDRVNDERKKSIEEYNREPYYLNVNLEIGEKIDVYSQVMINWQIFIDYIWNYKVNSQIQKKKPVCPDCGNTLKVASYHRRGDEIIVLCHCEECVDGIDSDWEGIYTKDEGYKDFTRYFFG